MTHPNSSHDDDLAIITTRARAQMDISHIYEFLGCRTSDNWLKLAKDNLPLLLQDHANCEKKAAGTAMNLIFRYEFHRELQERLAQLVREEMLHYEQVLSLMKDRGIEWHYLPAGRYAKGLLKHKRTHEPAAMVDVLIIGSFIEARSCERFSALADAIDDEKLARYYKYLLKSESRHYEDYLNLARSITDESIDERVAFFRDVERELIDSPDDQLRFHSGVPSGELMAQSQANA
ncbi:tRNA-(ms[2]io[6]A)-hydroxylase [Moraxella porci DSM 25326]|uniref:tRNA-(Ms[2]io[6]A)-hydroxylase n=1 Tax=Moraxella porci DSM 25326 TaxID=573983 RepID=A0A1T0CSH5_9GAMM|nr:tRNA-(ms[2]io[6]A)-hydroxylase [Moraxella porci]OOS25292.1 tRNA-(ms[2]io[6]A)-hydroxylase [Moraxella porci DSM 25326]